MFDAMNTQRTPSLSSVARAQLGLLFGNKYAPAMFTLAMLDVLCLYGLVVRWEGVPPWEGPSIGWFAIMFVFLGGISGAIVWFNEGPRSRGYHWAMPVKREIHDLIRLIAGAVWLIAILATVCAVVYVAEGPVIREQWLNHAPLFWASLFLVSLLAYLITAVASIAFDKPLFVILVVMITPLILLLPPVKRKAPVLTDIAMAVLDDKQSASLGTALVGAQLSAPWEQPEQKVRVYRATEKAYWASTEHTKTEKIRAKDAMLRPSILPAAPLVTTSGWLKALALWYIIALMGIALVIRRRPDV
jgi:hypothetical protein